MGKDVLQMVIGAVGRIARSHAVDCRCGDCAEVDGAVARAVDATRAAANAGRARRAKTAAKGSRGSRPKAAALGESIVVEVDGVPVEAELVKRDR